ncbi:serine/threonine protein kinase [Streptomyces sp. JCM17656]|nr:serine/threonine protein kinase [Streptomyces sp. JCM17656]
MSEGDRGPGRRVVDGRFELEARLGGGGMGTVWRARDLVLHRLVAVKEVRPPDRDLAEYDPEGARMLRERVLREARALARIDHPNVVTIHHIVDGGEATYPWIVMELVSGGSLADRLAQGPMPPADAARIGRGVLAALAAAHDAGIQHRDVKPANVLLRSDGRPVLTDFGIAAIRETTTNLTATGSIIGTPDFMAPERISGHEGGAASDLWSLAMMLYTALEGHHPLRRGTPLATLAAVLSDDVPQPVRGGALGGVLMSVLVRDPSARPSATELDRRLAEFESSPTGPAPVPNPHTSYPLNPRRRRLPPPSPLVPGDFGLLDHVRPVRRPRLRADGRPGRLRAAAPTRAVRHAPAGHRAGADGRPPHPQPARPARRLGNLARRSPGPAVVAAAARRRFGRFGRHGRAKPVHHLGVEADLVVHGLLGRVVRRPGRTAVAGHGLRRRGAHPRRHPRRHQGPGEGDRPEPVRRLQHLRGLRVRRGDGRRQQHQVRLLHLPPRKRRREGHHQEHAVGRRGALHPRQVRLGRGPRAAGRGRQEAQRQEPGHALHPGEVARQRLRHPGSSGRLPERRVRRQRLPGGHSGGKVTDVTPAEGQ